MFWGACEFCPMAGLPEGCCLAAAPARLDSAMVKGLAALFVPMRSGRGVWC